MARRSWSRASSRSRRAPSRRRPSEQPGVAAGVGDQDAVGRGELRHGHRRVGDPARLDALGDPPAPRTSSPAGRAVVSSNSAPRSRARSQPASRKTRPCSGPTTQQRVAGQALLRMGDRLERHAPANAREPLGLARELVDDDPRRLGRHQRHAGLAGGHAAVLGQRARAMSSSRSAKHARPCPAGRGRRGPRRRGRPPPTLRTVSCSARPIVLFARLPWPRQLPAAFIPTASASGPETTTSGPAGCVVAIRPCSANSGVARGLDRGEHDRKHLRRAAGHAPR